MTAVAVETRQARIVPALGRLATFVLVVAVLWGAWEGYKWLWETMGWTWPFVVDDTTMPHIHDILNAFREPITAGGPALIHPLLDAAWFTAKEALAGFALGAIFGFALAVVLVHSRLLERGLLPYVVASQTVPILAIAPMVVIGLGSKGVEGWKAVSVLAAYLTFFPVAINSLRGLKSADPRAFELMDSYAASSWSVLWRLRVPASLPYLFTALKISATAAVIGPRSTSRDGARRGRRLDPGADEVVPHGRDGAREHRPRGRAARVRLADRPLGLREVDAPADHRRPRHAELGHDPREPALLLMDEPFGALDEMTRERLNLELLGIWEKAESTIVFVTHSIPEAVFLSTRVVVMSPRPGRISETIEVDLPYPRNAMTHEEPRFFELVTAVREALAAGHGGRAARDTAPAAEER